MSSNVNFHHINHVHHKKTNLPTIPPNKIIIQHHNGTKMCQLPILHSRHIINIILTQPLIIFFSRYQHPQYYQTILILHTLASSLISLPLSSPLSLSPFLPLFLSTTYTHFHSLTSVCLNLLAYLGFLHYFRTRQVI